MDWFKSLKATYFDCDSIDLVNTVYLCYYYLLVVLYLVTSESLGIRQIKCLTPFNYKDSWDQYIDDLCYVEGTNFIKLKDPYPEDLNNAKKIRFYDILPLVLILAAMIFHLPRIMWSSIHQTSCLYFKEFCTASNKPRSAKFQRALQLFDDAMYTLPNELPYIIKIIFPRWLVLYFQNYYLTFFYLAFKVFSILNICLMQYLLCFFLVDTPHDIFGMDSTLKVLRGNNWKESGLFPRVVACQVNIRKMGTMEYDVNFLKKVDCVLPGHLFVEKFFAFSTLLHCVLIFASFLTLILWFKNLWYSKEYLEDLVKLNLSEKYDFSTFRHKALLKVFIYLFFPDGRFTFLMLKRSAAIYSSKALYISFIRNSSIGKRMLEAPEEDLTDILDEFLSYS